MDSLDLNTEYQLLTLFTGQEALDFVSKKQDEREGQQDGPACLTPEDDSLTAMGLEASLSAVAGSMRSYGAVRARLIDDCIRYTILIAGCQSSFASGLQMNQNQDGGNPSACAQWRFPYLFQLP